MLDELFGDESNLDTPATAVQVSAGGSNLKDTEASSARANQTDRSSSGAELISNMDHYVTLKAHTNGGKRSVDIDEELFGF